MKRTLVPLEVPMNQSPNSSTKLLFTPWISIAVVVVATAVGCGDSGATGGTTSSSSGTGTSTGTGTASTGTGMTCGTGGGGSEDVCMTTNFTPTCGPCMAANCCGVTQAAMGNASDASVIACAKGCCLMECYPPNTSDFNFECAPPASSPSNGACVSVGGPVQCNPITNQGCDTAAGEACDRQNTPGTTDQIGFKCYPNGNPPVNIHDVCQSCNDGLGYCKPGLSCFAQCGKYCCSDSDCSPGKCTKIDPTTNGTLFPVTPGVGLCVSQ